jgi:hypothetical protein
MDREQGVPICLAPETHLGVIIRGSLSTRARMSAKGRLPEPSTTEARNSSTGTPHWRSTSPTSRRLRRWRDRPASSPLRPPSSLTTSQLAYGPTARSAYTRRRAALRNGANTVETAGGLTGAGLPPGPTKPPDRPGMGGRRMQKTGIRVAGSYCCGPTLPITQT